MFTLALCVFYGKHLTAILPYKRGIRFLETHSQLAALYLADYFKWDKSIFILVFGYPASVVPPFSDE
jgi:hypothetical protein